MNQVSITYQYELAKEKATLQGLFLSAMTTSFILQDHKQKILYSSNNIEAMHGFLDGIQYIRAV